MALLDGQALPGIPAEDALFHLPFVPPNFVDFYSSLHHASNVGRRFRDPANPLPENWLHLPAAYNGRAGNVNVGRRVVRPSGQCKTAEGQIVFAPTRELDYEAEIGYFLCPAAPDRLAGFVLLNDWSARDIQRWEYVPLGPFLGKAFSTTISPYLVLPEALTSAPGPAMDPLPLPHLETAEPRNFDVEIEVLRRTPDGPEELSTRTNYRHMYWSHAQQIAHLIAGGVQLQLGDLHGSGTISSGNFKGEGSLLERGGPYLGDGETLIFRAWSGSAGFGEWSMRIDAAATR